MLSISVNNETRVNNKSAKPGVSIYQKGSLNGWKMILRKRIFRKYENKAYLMYENI